MVYSVLEICISTYVTKATHLYFWSLSCVENRTEMVKFLEILPKGQGQIGFLSQLKVLFYCKTLYVKQSHCRPGQAMRVPGD